MHYYFISILWFFISFCCLLAIFVVIDIWAAQEQAWWSNAKAPSKGIWVLFNVSGLRIRFWLLYNLFIQNDGTKIVEADDAEGDVVDQLNDPEMVEKVYNSKWIISMLFYFSYLFYMFPIAHRWTTCHCMFKWFKVWMKPCNWKLLKTLESCYLLVLAMYTFIKYIFSNKLIIKKYIIDRLWRKV